MLHIEAAFGAAGGAAVGAVGVDLVGAKLSQRYRFAHEVDVRAGAQLLIFMGQAALLRQQLDGVGRGGAHGDAGVGEQHLRIALFGLGAVGRGQHGAHKGVGGLPNGRYRAVEVFDLVVIERIPCINGIADLGEGAVGIKVGLQGVGAPQQLAQLIGRGRLFGRRLQFPVAAHGGAAVGAAINIVFKCQHGSAFLYLL